MTTHAQPVTIDIENAEPVSGLWQEPRGAQYCYVMAHSAGAGMTHPFLTAFANDLAERGVATLRYQFPYMERGSKRPDPPKVAHAAVRAAVAKAAQLMPKVALHAGGKSFGGRMTSQAQATAPLPGVRSLIFAGFPLHPAAKPASERGDHLFDVHVPMFFLQGTRDELAELRLVNELVGQLGTRATLRLFEEADHSFHVPARSGRRDADVHAELADAVAEWIVRIGPK